MRLSSRFTHIIQIILPCLVLFLPRFPVTAEPVDPLVIASSEFLPFFFQGSEGNPRGILVDFWSLWSQKTGQPVVFQLSDESRIGDLIRNEEADIVAGLAFTMENSIDMNFSRPFYEVTCYLFYRTSLHLPRGIEDLSGLRVGVVTGSYFHQYVQREQQEAVITGYHNISQLVEGAVDGDLDAFILENPVAMAYLGRTDGFRTFKKSLNPVTTKHYHAGIRKGDRTLLSLVNKGLSAISQEEMKTIVDTWTGEIRPSATSQPLKRVIIACSVGTAPFAFVDETGRPTGMFVEMWSLWSKKTGIEVEFKTTDWGKTLKLVGEGEADIHSGLFFSKERDTYLDYAAPLYKCTTHFFFHKSIYGLESLEDLIGFKIGIIEGDYAVEYVRRNLPEASLEIYPNNDALFQAAADGKVRVFIKDTPIGIYHLTRRNILNQFRYNLRNPLYSKTFYAAVREGDGSLLSIINTGMEAITLEERSAVIRNWMGTSDVKSQDVLVVGISDGYMPFTGISYRGEPTGMFVDIWRLWAEKTGQQIEFFPTDWAETLDGLKNGDVDIHSGLFRTKDRLTWIDFSQPFYRVPSTVFYHPKYLKPSGLEDLNGQRIGAIAGAYQVQYLQEQFPNSEVATFTDTEPIVDSTVALILYVSK